MVIGVGVGVGRLRYSCDTEAYGVGSVVNVSELRRELPIWVTPIGRGYFRVIRGYLGVIAGWGDLVNHLLVRASVELAHIVTFYNSDYPLIWGDSGVIG